MPITRFIGVDLAWGERTDGRPDNETGVVALDEGGSVVAAGWTQGVVETVAWIEAHKVDDSTMVFVDAPLVVDNESGQRICEKQVGQRYGKWQVSANTTNKKSKRQAGVPLLARLEALGWTYASGHHGPESAGLTVSECYPYTTLVGVVELYADSPPPGLPSPQRPRYKRAPKGMRAKEWKPMRAEQSDDLLRRLGKLRQASPPLDLNSFEVTADLLTSPSPEESKPYKHREDLLDAAVAAWTALYWSTFGLERCQVLGPPEADAKVATIIAPAIAEQRR